jgi:hypothetical protein
MELELKETSGFLLHLVCRKIAVTDVPGNFVASRRKSTENITHVLMKLLQLRNARNLTSCGKHFKMHSTIRPQWYVSS